MKFKIKKEKLSNILQIADKAISQIIPFPYLKGILIKVEKELITFITSDSHISIKTSLNNKEFFEVEEEGIFLIDEKMVGDITRKIDSEDINFDSVEKESITVYGGDSQFKLNTLDYENYPEIDFSCVGNEFEVNSCTLQTIIEKTAYACSEKEIHPNLTGINLFSKDGKLHASATDHFRLAFLSLNVEVNNDINIIIPKKYFISVVQCLKEDEIVKLNIQNNKIIFNLNETIIQTELVEDLFPDISTILKQQSSNVLIVDKNKLQKTIDRCSLIKDDKNKTIINLIIKNNKLSLSSRNSISSSNENVEIISYTGSDIDILYDSKFLQESLKVIDTKEVIIEFIGDLKPIFIKNKDDDSLISVISPQRR